MTTMFKNVVAGGDTEVELHVYRDSDMSRMDFEDCFHLYSRSGYRSTCRAFYTGWDGGDADVPVSISECYDLSKVTRKEARAWVIDFVVTEAYTSVWSVVRECKDDYDGDWLEFAQEILDNDYNFEFTDLFDDEKRPAIGEFKYDVVSVTGYSQGDYAEVMYDPEKWDGDSSAARKHFERLFYDAPVRCDIVIDGHVTYHMDELMKDTYEWDRNEMIKLIEENHSDDLSIDVRNWVYINLPEHPEYS